MEKIIDKLNKILALVERGEKHEAQAAKKKLDSLLQKFGLTINDLKSSDVQDYFIGFSSKTQKKLLIQIVVSNGFYPHRVSKNDKFISKVGVTATAIQFAELVNEYNWHKHNFNKELESFTTAYVHKHKLFPTDDLKNLETKQKEKDSNDAVKIALLLSSMEDNFYDKKRLLIQ